MQTWDEEQLAQLRPNYPNWDIWVVPHHIGGSAWCARPKGTPVATINTWSPEDLVKAIAEQESLSFRLRSGGEAEAGS